MRVLLLGGTADARELHTALRAAGIDVVESLAGRTAQARAAEGALVGGFGGAEGLASYLADPANQITAVVDATHPFAARMSQHAAEASAATSTPLLRLARTGWASHQHAADWVWVPDHGAAAETANHLGGRVLLTVGRQPLPAYHLLPDVVARVAEWQGAWTPQGWRIIEARGPFTLDAELDLLRSAQIATLVSKDSGGELTAAKLDAAHQLGVRVVMVARPAAPAGVPAVDTPAAVIAWLTSAPGPRPHR